MKYKNRVKDYLTPGVIEFGPGYWRWEVEDKILANIWKNIMNRYPKREKWWAEIYEAVKKDMEANYEVKVTVELKEKND